MALADRVKEAWNGNDKRHRHQHPLAESLIVLRPC